MIIKGNYSHELLHEAGAHLVEDRGGEAFVLPETFDIREVPRAALRLAKRKKRLEIDRAYQLAMDSGFVSSALGTPHFYATDGDRKALLSGAAASTAPRNYGCVEVATNVVSKKQHTPLQMIQVLNDGALVAEGCFDKRHEKMVAINAATTLEELALITW